ncbi:MAG: hypothetical protein GKS06_08450 [Acidobacteria bacterium]|nr:hypothetical protein [Acidobacteriota bacterium]
MTHDELNDEIKNRLDELPREIQPERNLWSDIETAIADSKIMRPDFKSERVTPPAGKATVIERAAVNWQRVGVIAAAAMLLVAFSSGITAYLVRVPAVPADGIVEPQRTEFETVAWEGFLAAERSYQSVTDELLAELDAQREELLPETVEIVEENLRLIDDAITRAREALELDPANTRLVNKLTGMYRTKVEFLEGMSRL